MLRGILDFVNRLHRPRSRIGGVQLPPEVPGKLVEVEQLVQNDVALPQPDRLSAVGIELGIMEDWCQELLSGVPRDPLTGEPLHPLWWSIPGVPWAENTASNEIVELRDLKPKVDLLGKFFLAGWHHRRRMGDQMGPVGITVWPRLASIATMHASWEGEKQKRLTTLWKQARKEAAVAILVLADCSYWRFRTQRGSSLSMAVAFADADVYFSLFPDDQPATLLQSGAAEVLRGAEVPAEWLATGLKFAGAKL